MRRCGDGICINGQIREGPDAAGIVQEMVLVIVHHAIAGGDDGGNTRYRRIGVILRVGANQHIRVGEGMCAWTVGAFERQAQLRAGVCEDGTVVVRLRCDVIRQIECFISNCPKGPGQCARAGVINDTVRRGGTVNRCTIDLVGAGDRFEFGRHNIRDDRARSRDVHLVADAVIDGIEGCGVIGFVVTGGIVVRR